MYCKAINRKKGVLFTVTAIMLLLSVYLLANAFSERSAGLSEAIIGLSFGDRLRFIEDDVVSSSYGQLLDIDLDNIERSASFMLRFDRFFESFRNSRGRRVNGSLQFGRSSCPSPPARRNAKTGSETLNGEGPLHRRIFERKLPCSTVG